MKYKVLCLTAMIFLILFSICSAAKEINPRGGGSRLIGAVAQQGDAKINFVRYFRGNDMYIELQHVTRGVDDYAVFHIQGDGIKDFDKVEIKTETGHNFILQQSDVKPAVYLPAKYVDKWYNVNLDDWENIKSDKKIVCVIHRKDGKTYEIKIDSFVSYVDAISKSAKDLPVTYGPEYSVFFPGKKYKEVKDAFAYHINERGSHDQAIAFNGYWRYAVDENSRTIGFSYDYTPQHLSYVKFVETPAGTWLNLDHWTCQNNGTFYSYDEWFDRTAIEDVTRKVYETYLALEPWGDYGIQLKGSPLKSPLVVDEVDLKLHPELTGLKSGDQIIAVNGKDTKDFCRYEMDYLMDYGKAYPDLKLTVTNKKQGVFEITAKARIGEPLVDKVDYEAINKKEDYLWYKKRTPLAYTPDWYAPYEIFDPYGPQNVSLVSPRTMSLAE